jgi:hypothetical protein
MPNGGKRALDRVCSSQVPPVLSGEVVESEQRVAILAEALDRLVIFAAVDFDEGIEGGFGAVSGLKLDPPLKIADEFRNAGIPLLIVISPYEYQLRGQDQNDSAIQKVADVMFPQKKIELFLSNHGVNTLDPANFLRSQVSGRADSLFLHMIRCTFPRQAIH